MRPLPLLAATFIGLAASTLATAQDSGSWLIRARAAHLDPANIDRTTLGLTINKKWMPEVDVSYFFSPNEALELVLTSPQSQTLHSEALGEDLGTFKHLPPTLLGQYHFTGLLGGLRPYVGLGVNYTMISSVKLVGGTVTLKRDSWGWAAQAGLDIPITAGWLLNLDVKKLQISTPVYSDGIGLGKFQVDPVLFSVGVGKRF